MGETTFLMQTLNDIKDAINRDQAEKLFSDFLKNSLTPDVLTRIKELAANGAPLVDANFPTKNDPLDFPNYLDRDFLEELDAIIRETIPIARNYHAKFYGVEASELHDGYFLTSDAHEVYLRKYALKDKDGNLIDKSVYATFARVAAAVAISSVVNKKIHEVATNDYKDEVDISDVVSLFSEFYSIMSLGLATGAGRIMANAGSSSFKPATTLINCTVMKQIPDSMEGIMDVLKDAAITLKSGAGVGYAFSTIRPKGAFVQGAGAETSGVISFMRVYDQMCQTIESAGGRRGAQMATLHVAHPEIEDYIVAKQKDGELRAFNLSVFATDDFMQAVEEDGDWELWFWKKTDDFVEDIGNLPEDVVLVPSEKTPFDFPGYSKFVFAADHIESIYGNAKLGQIFVKEVYKTVKASELYDKIMQATYEYSEPGILFYDTINKKNPINEIETLIATNPCFVGDTRISTSEGLIPIKELAERGGSFDIVVDKRAPAGGHGKPYGDIGTTIKTALKAFPTGKKPIRRLVTKEGYELTLTPDHKLLTANGYVEVQDLKPGDKVLIQSGEGRFGSTTELPVTVTKNRNGVEFPTTLTVELAELFGLWLGDGFVSEKVSGLTVSTADETELTAYKLLTHKSFGGYDTKHEESNTTQARVDVLASKYLIELGLDGKADTKRIPEFVFRAPKEMVAGFIRGYFAADGSVQMYPEGSRASLRFASSSLDLLKDLQLLLLNFGIYSRIRKSRDAGTRMLPDSNRNLKEYAIKAQYELIIGADNIRKFAEEIGFILDKHQQKYDAYVKEHGFRKFTKYYATVQEIIDEGYADVYDLTEPDTHSLIASGIISHNCGEAPLNPSGSCLLGSVYLHRFVKEPFKNIDPKENFDWDAFIHTTDIWNEFLDSISVITNLPLSSLRRETFVKRRHGLGFTGLADMLAALQLPYGKDRETVKFVELLTAVMEYQSFVISNNRLAEKYGPGRFTQDYSWRSGAAGKAMLNSPFGKTLREGYKKLVKKELPGLLEEQKELIPRYSHSLSIAPTGTISFTFGNNVANGIEPVYALAAIRNIIVPGKKTKDQLKISYFLNTWYKNLTGEDLTELDPSEWPEWVKTASYNVTVDDHVAIQAAVQKFTSQAISKTVNLPANYSFEDFKKLYLEGWKMGLKGVTSYKFNPAFSIGVLASPELLTKLKVRFKVKGPDGKVEEVEVRGIDSVFYDGEEHNAANLFEALKEGMYGRY